MFTPSLGGVQFSFLSQLQFFGGALRAAKSLGPSFCRIIARDSLSDLSVSSQDAGFQMLLPSMYLWDNFSDPNPGLGTGTCWTSQRAYNLTGKASDQQRTTQLASW